MGRVDEGKATVLIRGDLQETPGEPWQAWLEGQVELAGVSRGHSTWKMYNYQGRAERKRGIVVISSQDEYGKQNSWQQHCPRQVAVKPQGALGGPSSSSAQVKDETSGKKTMDLMEKTLERSNMFLALERVEANAGAPGIDGVTIKELRKHLREHWLAVKEQLLRGTYQPRPVRRVRIPKPDGGERMLGIPTVLDRLIQQALLQVMTPLFDPGFSESSYGFRPGRRGHDAVRQARQHVQEGYRWVVDVDLANFSDRVNHDILMARVARKVRGKRVLGLIRRYLQAGAMENGVKVTSEEGTPQGGPLSPLFANILLDDLDKELEKRGHRFCRYADDCNVYVRSRRAGERVMSGVRRFLETRLKLKVNEGKSAVDLSTRRKFLGFSLYFAKEGVGIRLAPKSIERVKEKLRRLTDRYWSISMEERIKRINQYMTGWLGYFALANAKQILARLQEWLRHRLRACIWVQWKRVRTRYRELRRLGLPEWKVHELANARKGPWRVANGPLNSVLTVPYWRSQGLMDLVDHYLLIRESLRAGEPPYAERHVRWCERTGARRPLLLDAPSLSLFGVQRQSAHFWKPRDER